MCLCVWSIACVMLRGVDPGQTRRVNGTSWLWAADLPKATHMAWIGGGTAGMRLKLKGEERHWYVCFAENKNASFSSS